MGSSPTKSLRLAGGWPVLVFIYLFLFSSLPHLSFLSFSIQKNQTNKQGTKRELEKGMEDQRKRRRRIKCTVLPPFLLSLLFSYREFFLSGFFSRLYANAGPTIRPTKVCNREVPRCADYEQNTAPVTYRKKNGVNQSVTSNPRLCIGGRLIHIN